MGSGIALAAAQNNYAVRLFDTNENVLNNAKASINKNLDFLLEKNKITAVDERSTPFLQQYSILSIQSMIVRPI